MKAQAVEKTYEKSNFIVTFIKKYMYPSKLSSNENVTKTNELAIDKTRLRIIEVLCTWLEVHFYDFLADRSLGQQLINFIESNITSEGSCSTGFNRIKDLITSKLNTKPPEPDLLAPVSRLPPCPVAGHFDLYDLSSVEVARQFTLKHLGMFKKIAIQEFLSQNWSKVDAAPGIVEYMKEFNRCSYWVSTYCTTPSTASERCEIITKFIHIALACVELQNYHTAMAIISGLNNTAVTRLKMSWGLVSTEDIKRFGDLVELMSSNSNWSNYRNVLCKASPPLLPYLGLFLDDLTFLEDGDFVGVHNLINFKKWSTNSCIFQNIQKFQSSVYHLVIDKEIKKYLKHLTVIGNYQDLFNMSLKQEPQAFK